MFSFLLHTQFFIFSLINFTVIIIVIKIFFVVRKSKREKAERKRRSERLMHEATNTNVKVIVKFFQFQLVVQHACVSLHNAIHTDDQRSEYVKKNGRVFLRSMLKCETWQGEREKILNSYCILLLRIFPWGNCSGMRKW